MFHDLQKLYEIQILMFINKILRQHSHASFTYVLLSMVAFAEPGPKRVAHKGLTIYCLILHWESLLVIVRESDEELPRKITQE